jgi:hypothetical protein
MNRTRCPWCGKRTNDDKSTNAEQRSAIERGAAQICPHCRKKYKNKLPPMPLLITAVILCAIILFFILDMFMPRSRAWGCALLFVTIIACFKSKFTYFQRINDKTNRTLKLDEKLKFRVTVTKQYYNIDRANIYPIFANHDERESFSTVSPIFISKFDIKANEIEGYWLYDHCDNAYFASLDQVHLYDDDGNVVADVKFQS